MFKTSWSVYTNFCLGKLLSRRQLPCDDTLAKVTNYPFACRKNDNSESKPNQNASLEYTFFLYESARTRKTWARKVKVHKG